MSLRTKENYLLYPQKLLHTKRRPCLRKLCRCFVVCTCNKLITTPIVISLCYVFATAGPCSIIVSVRDYTLSGTNEE